MTAAIGQYLDLVLAHGASDLHLSAGRPPGLRVDGDIITVDGHDELTAQQIHEMVLGMIPDYARQDLERYHDADFSYEHSSGKVRFRVNAFIDRKGAGLVARLINARIPSLDQLGMPNVLGSFCKLNKGLFIVTGPSGAGKSTTLAAMIDRINSTRLNHIITIEDPIEYVHESKKCLVTQREVPQHACSFSRALRAALREDPDVVLVGEMRDLETIQIAIETAETGHLVLGTLHTSTAYSAVDRIIDVFPPGRQAQIRMMLASSLRGVLAQTLCRKIGGGRVAATELLTVTAAAANMIREGNMHQIPSLMQTGKEKGMHLMEDSLARLVAAGRILVGEAQHHANNKDLLYERLTALGVQTDVPKKQEASSLAADEDSEFFAEDADWLNGE